MGSRNLKKCSYSLTTKDEGEPFFSILYRTLSNKKYELTYLLGNVRTVFTDLKIPNAGTFELDVLVSNNYYPFGIMLPIKIMKIPAAYMDFPSGICQL